jgi:hypothetical protein
MAVTIGELTTEVIAEPDKQLAGSGVPSVNKAEEHAMIRTELATILRQALRTRAEGFDD